MKSSLAAVFLLFVFINAKAQPYVDPLQVRYTYAFRSDNSAATPFMHLWAGCDLPIKLRDKTYQLLSPFYESWRLDSADSKNVLPTVQSIAFPIGFLFPLHNEKWSMNLMPIVRWNGEKLFGENTFQFGGVAFVSYEKKPGMKFRLGMYANSDFFGLFVMPLFGTDWRINKRNYLFGLLPGRLTWEHQFTNRLYGGSTFRAITNSYRLADGKYVRIDDNQLSPYLDAYLSKHICLTLEPGYGIMRKLRTGNEKKQYITDRNWGDGLFIKLSASYRIRL